MIKSSTKLQVPCDECGKFTSDLWEAYFQGAIPSYLCESCKEDLGIFAAFVQKFE